MASGINNTCRQVGIATGIAGLGAVFQHQVQSKVAQHVPGNEAFAGGLNAILMIGAILAFATAVIGFALVRRSDLVEGAAQADIPKAGSHNQMFARGH
jgi:F0F1-type ATP synthase membrane subunit c/vacuolar-type H+-ATPase subunit K